MTYCMDFETYWDKDEYTLSDMGVISYVRDPRFRLLCAGMCTVDGVGGAGRTIGHGPIEVWDANPGVSDPLPLPPLSRDNLLCHNVMFDGFVLAERLGRVPRLYIDTWAMAQWAGLGQLGPTSLKALGQRFGMTKGTGTVVSSGKRRKEDFTEQEWRDFRKYCANDVEMTARIFNELKPYVTRDAFLFTDITTRMYTRPRLVLDMPGLREYARFLKEESGRRMAETMAEHGFSDREAFRKALRSKARFAEMLRRLGVEPPMKTSPTTGKEDYAFAKTDPGFQELLEHEDEVVRMLAEARVGEASSIERTRCDRLLEVGADGRPVPVGLAVFGARTGRYAAGSGDRGRGDRLNFQNLGKRSGNVRLRRCIRAPIGYKIVACDSAQIEARMLAWVAGQDDLVSQFREGQDPYAILAATFTPGKTWQEIRAGAKAHDEAMYKARQAAKTAILSAGYGVGATKFADTLWVKEKVRFGEDRTAHDAEALKVHRKYRMMNARIVDFWRLCESVLRRLVQPRCGVTSFGGPSGELVKAGRIRIPGEGWPVPGLRFPCGWKTLYPGLRFVDGEFWYDAYSRGRKVETRLYGGKVCENVIQGLSMHVLMWQACRMREAGLQLAGNVHDCWFCVVPEAEAEDALATMVRIMSTVPPWAEGFPVSAEGEIGEDYTVC